MGVVESVEEGKLVLSVVDEPKRPIDKLVAALIGKDPLFELHTSKEWVVGKGEAELLEHFKRVYATEKYEISDPVLVGRHITKGDEVVKKGDFYIEYVFLNHGKKVRVNWYQKETKLGQTRCGLGKRFLNIENNLLEVTRYQIKRGILGIGKKVVEHTKLLSEVQSCPDEEVRYIGPDVTENCFIPDGCRGVVISTGGQLLFSVCWINEAKLRLPRHQEYYPSFDEIILCKRHVIDFAEEYEQCYQKRQER